jgi:hypothetical protein
VPRPSANDLAKAIGVSHEFIPANLETPRSLNCSRGIETGHCSFQTRRKERHQRGGELALLAFRASGHDYFLRIQTAREWVTTFSICNDISSLSICAAALHNF